MIGNLEKVRFLWEAVSDGLHDIKNRDVIEFIWTLIAEIVNGINLNILQLEKTVYLRNAIPIFYRNWDLFKFYYSGRLDSTKNAIIASGSFDIDKDDKIAILDSLEDDTITGYSIKDIIFNSDTEETEIVLDAIIKGNNNGVKWFPIHEDTSIPGFNFSYKLDDPDIIEITNLQNEVFNPTETLSNNIDFKISNNRIYFLNSPFGKDLWSQLTKVDKHLLFNMFATIFNYNRQSSNRYKSVVWLIFSKMANGDMKSLLSIFYAILGFSFIESEGSFSDNTSLVKSVTNNTITITKFKETGRGFWNGKEFVLDKNIIDFISIGSTITINLVDFTITGHSGLLKDTFSIQLEDFTFAIGEYIWEYRVDESYDLPVGSSSIVKKDEFVKLFDMLSDSVIVEDRLTQIENKIIDGHIFDKWTTTFPASFSENTFIGGRSLIIPLTGGFAEIEAIINYDKEYTLSSYFFSSQPNQELTILLLDSAMTLILAVELNNSIIGWQRLSGTTTLVSPITKVTYQVDLDSGNNRIVLPGINLGLRIGGEIIIDNSEKDNGIWRIAKIIEDIDNSQTFLFLANHRIQRNESAVIFINYSVGKIKLQANAFTSERLINGVKLEENNQPSPYYKDFLQDSFVTRFIIKQQVSNKELTDGIKVLRSFLDKSLAIELVKETGYPLQSRNSSIVLLNETSSFFSQGIFQSDTSPKEKLSFFSNIGVN